MMFGVNSRDAMRLIAQLQSDHQAPPERVAAIRQPRQSRHRAPSPVSESSSESDSDSSSYCSSASSDYEDTDTIYRKVVEEEKCQYVSPAGLKQNSKSRKQAATYLKGKKCPVVEKIKKTKAAPAPAPEPAKPTTTFVAPRVELTPEGEQILHTGILKKARKPRTVVKSEPAAPSMNESPAAKAAAAAAAVSAPASAAPAAAAPAAAKTKRAPNAYNLFVAEQRKAGKSMKEAADAWRAKKSA